MVLPVDTERQHSIYHVDSVVLGEPAVHLAYDGSFLGYEALRGHASLLFAKQELGIEPEVKFSVACFHVQIPLLTPFHQVCASPVSSAENPRRANNSM